MQIYSTTDTGLVRHNNEDYHRYDNKRQLMILADGVGGHAYGEIASRIAVESAYQYWLRNETLPEEESLETPHALLECMSFANQKVLTQQNIRPDYYNMGTTLVMAVVEGDTLYYAWVGDSRIYHVDAETRSIRQLSIDHSLLQEAIDGGTLDPEKMAPGNIITRVIGSMYSAKPESGKAIMTAGDMILLCSDGLTDMVDDEKICDILLTDMPLYDLPRALVSEAYKAGAHDNVTAIVTRIP
jgi:serine/threonine protein phosphatase PrpC